MARWGSRNVILMTPMMLIQIGLRLVSVTSCYQSDQMIHNFVLLPLTGLTPILHQFGVRHVYITMMEVWRHMFLAHVYAQPVSIICNAQLLYEHASGLY